MSTETKQRADYKVGLLVKNSSSLPPKVSVSEAKLLVNAREVRVYFFHPAPTHGKQALRWAQCTQNIGASMAFAQLIYSISSSPEEESLEEQRLQPDSISKNRNIIQREVPHFLWP